ncbi:ABC transporter permease [Candidatus Dependentiae bacterium]
MNTFLLIKTSLKSLKNHTGRSILTILGIIIGIASIISTLAIGYGAEKKLTDRIMSMGKNFIFIQPGKVASEGKTSLTHRRKPNHLTFNDVEIFKQQFSEIKKITPVMFSRKIISHKGNNVLVDIKCGNQDYLDVVERKIKYGNNFNKIHIQKNSKVIILGHKTTTELFRSTNPIGKSVKIQNVLYTVIGTTKKIKSYLGIMNPNLDIYIPITTAKKHIFHKNNSKIHGISISTKKKIYMSKLVRHLKRNLRFRHNLTHKDPDDFTIFDQQAMAKAAKKSSNILSLLLLIIASISLLVGGIGVMNIMLVSISERTQEIGIRMAIGATTFVILEQFIIESIILCLIGGIIGTSLGIITPYIISIFTKWPVIIKFSSIIIAFGITFIIGIIFGFYPARKAAKLNPVTALQDR